MISEQKEIGYSIIESIKSSEISKLTPDLLEVGVDKILNDDIIKEFPVVRLIQALYKTVVTVSDRILIKKIVLFLKGLGGASKADIDKFIDKMNNEPTKQKKIGDKLLLILDKSDDFEKSFLIAEVFKYYLIGEIDYDTFQLLCNAINNTYLGHLKNLKQYYEILHNSQRLHTDIYENLFHSGLVGIESYIVTGASGIEYIPNNLGSLLIKILFK